MLPMKMWAGVRSTALDWASEDGTAMDAAMDGWTGEGVDGLGGGQVGPGCGSIVKYRLRQGSLWTWSTERCYNCLQVT